jgi:chaperone modulatory protein CbpM
MTTLDELLRQHGQLTEVHVERWVSRGLLRPAGSELGFDDESVETVVDLVDQVHTLRRQLDLLGRAISEQPAATREAIAVALDRLSRR